MTEPEAPLTEDQPNEAAPEAPEGDKPQPPAYFDEKFDPAQLPDELRPAYNQLRGDYTRKTQELSQQRQEFQQEQQLLQALRSNDPDLQRQALDVLGYQFPDDEEQDQPEYEFEDPTEQRLAALEQALTQQYQQALEDQQVAQIETHLDGQLAQIKSDTGRDFSQSEQQAIEALAFAHLDQNGLPDIRAAYEHLYNDVLPAERKRWVAGKRNAAAAPVGTSGSPKIDMRDDKARREYMASVIEAGMDDE